MGKGTMTKAELLRIILSWKAMIENYEKTGKKYPTAVLNDLAHSMDYVLAKEGVVEDYE